MRAPAADPRRAWAVPLLALLLALAAAWAEPTLLRGLRYAVFDQFQRWHPRPTGDDLPVRIIDIDDESLQRIGQWPWPRDEVARLLQRLGEAGPAAIALDMMFAEPDRSASADEQLARTLAEGRVTLGFGTVRTGGGDGLDLKPGYLTVGGDPTRFLPEFRASVDNLPALQAAAAGQGAMTILPDVDGIVRRVPLVLNVGGRPVPSLSAEALRLAVGAQQYTLHAEGDHGGLIGIDIGPNRIETDDAGALWVHYARPHPGRYISAWRVLAGLVPAEELAGRIVLVGTSAQGLQDLRFSPMGSIIPGVEVHAQALEQVLGGHGLRRPGWTPAVEWLLTLLCGGLAGLLAMKRTAAVAAAGAAVLAAAAGLGSWMAFVHGGLLIDPVTPLLAIALVFLPTLVMQYLRSELQQRWMKQTFSRYVSPNLVDYLVAHPEALMLQGRRQRCSFVFTDLAGFTRLMETMDPAVAVGVLNRYLDRMIAIAFEHEGTLDRIVGDAVAIMFSAPVEQQDHERRALNCALAMHAFSRRYVDELARQGLAFSETRIGVHTGEVTVGNFGGDAIFDYRALGDPVNTAARLESANKHLGTLICVSEATLAGCAGAATRPIGRLRLAGRSGLVMTHEPLPAGQPLDTAYAQAYALMQAGDGAALAAFEALAEERPDDPLVRLHVARLRGGSAGDTIELTEK